MTMRARERMVILHLCVKTEIKKINVLMHGVNMHDIVLNGTTSVWPTAKR